MGSRPSTSGKRKRGQVMWALEIISYPPGDYLSASERKSVPTEKVHSRYGTKFYMGGPNPKRLLLICNYQAWCHGCNSVPMASDALLEFQNWQAKTGERYVYASNVAVMGDIERHLREGRGWMDKIRPVRLAARNAYEAGEVLLFQRRNGTGFDYIAERR